MPKPSIWLHHPCVTVIYGRRGSGKSTLIRFINSQWDVDGRIFAVDALAREGIGACHDLHADKVLSAPPLSVDSLKGVSLLTVDEADMHYPQKETKERRQNPVIDYMLKRGRHHDLTLILASQRPSFVGYNAWSLADNVFIFCLTSEIDLRRVCEIDGEIAKRKLEISQLQPGECFHWRAFVKPGESRIQKLKIRQPRD